MENYQLAREVLTTKEWSRKIELLNKILDESLKVASNTGELDLTLFITGCFLAEINDELITAKAMRESNLLEVVTAFNNPDTFERFVEDGQILAVIEMETPRGIREVEIKVMLDISMLTGKGNEHHARANFSVLDVDKVKSSLKRVVAFFYSAEVTQKPDEYHQYIDYGDDDDEEDEKYA